jgi:pentatricopeptide repeat protein
MCDAEEHLLNVPDTDFISKKKLYETMGDGCVAVKNYAKALEYYHKMLEVGPSSLDCTVYVLFDVHDILSTLVACLDVLIRITYDAESQVF